MLVRLMIKELSKGIKLAGSWRSLFTSSHIRYYHETVLSVTNECFQHTHFPFRHLEIFNSIKKSMSLTKFQIVAVIFAKGCQATLSQHNAYIL